MDTVIEDDNSYDNKGTLIVMGNSQEVIKQLEVINDALKTIGYKRQKSRNDVSVDDTGNTSEHI